MPPLALAADNTPPLRFDALSGWALAPRTGWDRGEGLLRCFDTAEAAIGFLKQARFSGDAERQRRRRERARRGEIVAPVPISGPVLDVLTNLRWLAERDAEDRTKIGAAVGALLADLAHARPE